MYRKQLLCFYNQYFLLDKLIYPRQLFLYREQDDNFSYSSYYSKRLSY